ncbi:hypothetical protein HIR71_12515 [Cellulomonas fimi]|uniref:Uncharacterized protein n=1 Tax=Cellulomonas fimi TaxID=1708 RepID=A0A7Y0QJ68_CELFI|nr:hypothetical protein [Cellulomonas fimi]
MVGPTGAAPGWDVAWSDALADLELSVADAEALLRAGHATGPVGPGWVPPSHLGQLPAPLVERAQALLDRQVRVARGLAAAAAQSRRELRAVEQLRATPEATPVYLDTAG